MKHIATRLWIFNKYIGNKFLWFYRNFISFIEAIGLWPKKRLKKSGKAKPWSLACHIKYFTFQHAEDFFGIELPWWESCGAVRSLNFVTVCPSSLYFSLYSTIQFVSFNFYGYSHTVYVLFDIEKKNEPIIPSERRVPENRRDIKRLKNHVYWAL